MNKTIGTPGLDQGNQVASSGGHGARMRAGPVYGPSKVHNMFTIRGRISHTDGTEVLLPPLDGLFGERHPDIWSTLDTSAFLGGVQWTASLFLEAPKECGSSRRVQVGPHTNVVAIQNPVSILYAAPLAPTVGRILPGAFAAVHPQTDKRGGARRSLN